MKILDVTQGSVEWIRARLGVATASEFHRIIQPHKLKPSAGQEGYAAEKIAEWALRCPLNEYQSAFMDRGGSMEEGALFWYEWERDATVKRVGFCLRDDGMVGCSPDGLVGDDGLVEIKVPAAATHVENLLGRDPISGNYRAQIQGNLWITGRKWADFVSYHPTMPSLLVRVERDEAFIAALAPAVEAFVARVKAGREELLKRGFVPKEEEIEENDVVDNDVALGWK